MKKMLLVLAVIMVVLTGCNRKDNGHNVYMGMSMGMGKLWHRMVNYVAIEEEKPEIDPIIKNKDFNRVNYLDKEVAE